MNNGPFDEKTAALESLVLRIAHDAARHRKKYYIGGGFAIDIAFGGLSRAHDDIDFYPLEADTLWWKKWFSEQGYAISIDVDMAPLRYAFLVSGQVEPATGVAGLADVYPIAVDDVGSISMAVRPGATEVWDGMLSISGGRGIWPGKSWRNVHGVMYKGCKIFIEDYHAVLAQKEAYIRLHPSERLGDKHLHDFRRAGTKPSV